MKSRLAFQSFRFRQSGFKLGESLHDILLQLLSYPYSLARQIIPNMSYQVTIKDRLRIATVSAASDQPDYTADRELLNMLSNLSWNA